MIDSDSKYFCMSPWVHLHVWPNGMANPCCVTAPQDSKMSLSDGSIQQLFNCEQMKELRQNIINGRPTKSCQSCYELNQSGFGSVRDFMNSKFKKKHFAKVMKTLPDGTAPEFNMAYLDIRFSNICNFKCRNCSPDLSSSWYEDSLVLKYKHLTTKNLSIESAYPNFMSNLKKFSHEIEEIYFAGGEPLLMKEHWELLDFLDQNKLYDIELKYNTNFSKINFQNKNIFDYWSKFKKVSVQASIDASGKRAELLRKGQNWDEFILNRRDMQKQLGNSVQFNIDCTVSLSNVWHIPDLHKELIENNLIEPHHFRLNLLQNPEEYRIQVLPSSFKQEIMNKYEEHIKYLKSIDHYHFYELGCPFKNTINFMLSEDRSYDIAQFINRTKKLDQIRNEKFFNVFPELKFLTQM